MNATSPSSHILLSDPETALKPTVDLVSRCSSGNQKDCVLLRACMGHMNWELHLYELLASLCQLFVLKSSKGSSTGAGFRAPGSRCWQLAVFG